MKKQVLLIWVMGFVILVSYGFVMAIPNPAPIYCENMGYVSNNTHCIFNDNNSCEVWAFYNGECGKEYIGELECKKEGESLSPGHECCEGLVSILPGTVFDETNGICITSVGGWSICVPCGNGICDKELENSCNCPEDCSEINNKSKIICSAPNCAGSYGIGKRDSDGCTIWICPVCGNGDCEGSFEKQTCLEDCEGSNESKQNQSRNHSRATECQMPAVPLCPEETKLVSLGRDEHGCLKPYKCVFKSSETDEAVEIKIMPETASERAIERLGQLNFTVELKEVGKGNQARAVYELNGEKQGKFLGLFKIRVRVQAQIDAETGDVVKIKKPWWRFLVLGV